jgi:cell division protein FtsA
MDGSIKHTAVLSLGGNYVTSDIAVGLRTPAVEAERIKIRYGCTYTPLIAQNETIEVPSVGGRVPRKVSRQVLGEIIEPRVAEILGLAHREIIKSGYEDMLAAGIVLTGGTSILEGMTELGDQVFNMPVRKGCPLGVGGITDVINSPMYATGVGLVLYGSRAQPDVVYKKGGINVLNKTVKKITNWFNDFF